MKSDVKIGIALGIIVAVGLMIWFTTRGEKTETPSPIIVVPEKPEAKPAPAPAPRPAPVIPPVTPETEPAPAAPSPAPVIPEVSAPVPAPTAAPEPAPIAVPAPVVTPPAAEKPAPQDKDRPKERFHTVAPGETLSQISEMYYGQSKHWNVIYEANRNVIKDKDILIPGKKLRIPYPEEITAAKRP